MLIRYKCFSHFIIFYIRIFYKGKFMLLSLFNKYFLSAATPILLMISGIIITLKLRGFYIFHPVRSAKLLLRREARGETSPFSALCLALAGTLGVGNIVGVASAIMTGGYGAVFWMWVSAALAMSLKYAEIVISMKYRRVTDKGYRGGAAYYICAAFRSLKLNRSGRILAQIFVIFCVLNSLTMGCMLQSNAISSSLSHVLEIKPAIIGLAVAALLVASLLYKSGKVEKITNIIVPIMSLLYIVFCLIAILLRRDRIDDAFAIIFKDAFNLESVGGGALGFLTSRAFRAGSMRGLVSNEAGAGTAPTAHALSDTKIPEKQGLMGVFEVFADTIILCTLTAIVIIISGADLGVDNPMILIMNSFSADLGKPSDYFLCVSIFLFAFATLICWAKYGLSALEYLIDRPCVKGIYIFVFAVLVILGTVFTSNAIWDASDFSIGIMTIINLIAIFILRKEITRPELKRKSYKL